MCAGSFGSINELTQSYHPMYDIIIQHKLYAYVTNITYVSSSRLRTHNIDIHWFIYLGSCSKLWEIHPTGGSRELPQMVHVAPQSIIMAPNVISSSSNIAQNWPLNWPMNLPIVFVTNCDQFLRVYGRPHPWKSSSRLRKTSICTDSSTSALCSRRHPKTIIFESFLKSFLKSFLNYEKYIPPVALASSPKWSLWLHNP